MKFACAGEHKWVTVHGSGQLNFSELLVPPALLVQLMFLKPEQMQMTLESEEVRRTYSMFTLLRLCAKGKRAEIVLTKPQTVVAGIDCLSRDL